jgi:hypothetical protein
VLDLVKWTPVELERHPAWILSLVLLIIALLQFALQSHVDFLGHRVDSSMNRFQFLGLEGISLLNETWLEFGTLILDRKSIFASLLSTMS